MRIGIAAIGRLSEDTGGKNYIIHFLAELVRLNPPHEFVLFVSESEAEALNLQESSTLKILTIPNSKRTPIHKVLAEQIRLPKYLKREKIDLMYYPGNFICLRSDVPAVVNIRSSAHFYGPEYGIRGSRRWMRRLLMKPSARKAKAIITPSESIKRDVIQFAKIDADKIHVIPHGVDTSLFNGETNRLAPEGRTLLERNGLVSGSYLLYVSALWRYKKQDQLIRAHAELAKNGFPTLKLVLAGMGTGIDRSYIDELHALPKQLGTDHLVVFTGGLPQRDLRYLYAHASAFIFPSIYESFGNPIFEAWASGIPVATANVHSFPEIVDQAGLLFDPENVQDIVAATRRLLTDPVLRSELISHGKERAKKFSWESCVRRTLSLLEDVTSPAAMSTDAP